MLGCETEDVEAVQQREDIGRNNLEKEHSSECTPKQLQPFVIGRGVKVERYHSRLVSRFTINLRYQHTLEDGNRWQVLR